MTLPLRAAMTVRVHEGVLHRMEGALRAADPDAAPPPSRYGRKRSMQLPLILGVVAALIVLIAWAGVAWGWPFILIAIVGGLILRRTRRTSRAR